MENYIKIDGVQIELTKEQVEQIKSLGISSNKKPQWEDFGEIRGGYVSSGSSTSSYYSISTDCTNKNVFPSVEETEACLALSQLCQWRDKYNEGWKPNWKDNYESKYCIIYFDDNILTESRLSTHTVLSFKTKEIRDKFLEDFRDLIEIAKPLL